MITNSSSVRTTIIASDDQAHTYEVKKELLDAEGVLIKGNDAVLVALYPTTKAEEAYQVDLSTTHLVAKMEELGLRSVRIVNLFSKVSKTKMSVRGLEVDQENMAYIEEMMKEPGFQSSLLILAWGSSMTTCHAANVSKARISNMFSTYCPKGKLYQLTAPGLDLDNNETVHVLYLGIRHKQDPWSLAEYKFPKKPTPIVAERPKSK